MNDPSRGKIENATAATFEHLALASPIPVVVDFWAPWCVACRKLAPAYEAVAAETDGLRFLKVNVDEEPGLADRYEIQSLPTLKFFRGGRPIAQAEGPMHVEELRALARDVLAPSAVREGPRARTGSARRAFWSALARLVAIGSLVALMVVPLAALVLDRAFGRDVVLVVPHDAASVEVNRALWTAGEPVGDLYGNALGAPVRVLAPDPARLIVPAEDPALRLLAVDKNAGENPIQVQTVWFFARLAVLASAGAGSAAALAWLLLSRGRFARAARRTTLPPQGAP